MIRWRCSRRTAVQIRRPYANVVGRLGQATFCLQRRHCHRRTVLDGHWRHVASVLAEASSSARVAVRSADGWVLWMVAETALRQGHDAVALARRTAFETL